MPSRHVRLAAQGVPPDVVGAAHGAFAAVRAEFELPDAYPDAALQEAAAPRALDALPDETGIELVTLDPPGATDLDQAMAITRRTGVTGSGTPSPTCPQPSTRAAPSMPRPTGAGRRCTCPTGSSRCIHQP